MLVEKNNKKMNVSKKAFNLLYKAQGFKPAEELETEESEDETSLRKMKVADLKELAAEKEIEGYEDMKKEELIAALEEVM